MDDARLDALLSRYEDRKQKETQEQVRRALALEESRRKGAEQMRRVLLTETREASERLERAGHTVAYQESLDAYPPRVRMHVWPKRGPMDVEEPRRVTVEFTWGDPDEQKLGVRRWSTEGLGNAVDQGSAGPGELDNLWVREQILTFVRVLLSSDEE